MPFVDRERFRPSADVRSLRRPVPSSSWVERTRVVLRRNAHATHGTLAIYISLDLGPENLPTQNRDQWQIVLDIQPLICNIQPENALSLRLTAPLQVVLMPDADLKQTSYKIEDRFGPVALAAALLGLILGVLESLLKVVSLLESNFYFCMTVLWILALALSRYYPKRGLHRIPIQRLWIVVAATIALLASIGYTYYEHHIRVTYPAKPPEIPLTEVVPAIWSTEPQQSLRLISFYLNEDLCSFEKSKAPLFANGPSVTTFAINREVVDAFKRGTCTGVDGERPMVAAGSAIRKWLATTDRASLVEYLSDPMALGRLARERGDVFKKILPSAAELSSIKRSAPDDYEVIKHWLLNCVGIYQPVFTAALTNAGTGSINIVRVQYEVKLIGQVKGGEPGGPVWPEVTYDHTISHIVGTQTFDLQPVFNIPEGSTKALNLRLHSVNKQPGLGWYLRIRFVDSNNHSAATDLFQLFLNPK